MFIEIYIPGAHTMMSISPLSRIPMHRLYPTAVKAGAPILSAPSLPFYRNKDSANPINNRIFSRQTRELHIPIFSLGIILTSMNNSMGPVVMFLGVILDDDTDDEA